MNVEANLKYIFRKYLLRSEFCITQSHFKMYQQLNYEYVKKFGNTN